MSTRAAKADRKTTETQIALSVNLDGSGKATLATGVPFLDHMLDQVARHAMLDLDIQAKGDLQIDAHHTVEDVGITLGQAVARAVGDKKGIRRYGHAYVPLDEALSRVVIDFSGRPGLEYHVQFKRALIGEFDVDLVHEFFQGFANHAQVTLHIDNLRGDNAHHQCETMFKAFARALRMALEPDPRAAGTIPSTKGTLYSVSKAVEHVAPHASVEVTSDPAHVAGADRVVFPGQGAMPDCMREMDARGLRPAVLAAARSRPFLGICIGLQMLFERSDEGGVAGLALLPGAVRSFPAEAMVDPEGRKLKVPHIGWNRVKQTAPPVVWHRGRQPLLFRPQLLSADGGGGAGTGHHRLRRPLYLRRGTG